MLARACARHTWQVSLSTVVHALAFLILCLSTVNICFIVNVRGSHVHQRSPPSCLCNIINTYNYNIPAEFRRTVLLLLRIGTRRQKYILRYWCEKTNLLSSVEFYRKHNTLKTWINICVLYSCYLLRILFFSPNSPQQSKSTAYITELNN